jgi:DNA-binding SARP family transcriptional activator
MSLLEGTISDTEKKKIKSFIDEALNTFQEIEDRKGALNDLGKVLAEELGIKPALLMKAARSVYKQTLEDDKEAVETIEELLIAAGRA